MVWKKAIDPLAPVLPREHSPTRCMNCGHEEKQHDGSVGCLVEGGTKYIENENNEAIRACTCEKFVPV